MPELEKQHFGDDSLQLFEALESRKWTDTRAALQAVPRACAANLRLGGGGELVATAVPPPVRALRRYKGAEPPANHP